MFFLDRESRRKPAKGAGTPTVLRGIRPMGSRHSAILILIAGFLVASSTAGNRSIKDRAALDPSPIRHDCGKPKYDSPSIPRPSSVAIYSPWRSRIKSVLEETSPRIIEESDLGPAPNSTHAMPFVPSGSSLSRRVGRLPMRC